MHVFRRHQNLLVLIGFWRIYLGYVYADQCKYIRSCLLFTDIWSSLFTSDAFQTSESFAVYREHKAIIEDFLFSVRQQT